MTGFFWMSLVLAIGVAGSGPFGPDPDLLDRIRIQANNFNFLTKLCFTVSENMLWTKNWRFNILCIWKLFYNTVLCIKKNSEIVVIRTWIQMRATLALLTTSPYTRIHNMLSLFKGKSVYY